MKRHKHSHKPHAAAPPADAALAGPIRIASTLAEPAPEPSRRPAVERPDAADRKLFINRELSWTAFNERVLAEARDETVPLFERLKFLGIVSGNLDEFFMVRVAGLKHQILSGVAETSADGLLPAEQLAALSERVHAMTAELYRTWRESVQPQLAAQGIQVLSRDALTPEQRAAARTYFLANVFPALTPLAVDPGHPFPHLRNKSLNIAVLLRREATARRLLPTVTDETLLAVVQVPQVLGRLLRLPPPVRDTGDGAAATPGGSGPVSNGLAVRSRAEAGRETGERPLGSAEAHTPAAGAAAGGEAGPAASTGGPAGAEAHAAPGPAEPPRCVVLLEELIAAHVGELFPGYAVVQTAPFRVTRDGDLHVDEEESEDLLSTVQQELRRRDRGMPVRLEVAQSATSELRDALTHALKLEDQDVYTASGPLALTDLLALTELDHRAELRYEPFQPATPLALKEAESIFAAIKQADVLLHHPYESFDPVVRFIEEAADDPSVLAIKQTLYRTSGDSPFVRAISRAADHGKQVTVFVEIKARFDEANNIAWARRLEENGVHVVYGLIGLKTHAKVALVVRREGTRIRRYVHLGTGNYNPTTARSYTDLSLFTAREEIGDDVSALFNMLTGYAEPPQWKRLRVAPFGLQDRILQLIEQEAQLARRGQPARIVAKMNSLVDPAVIRALYAASQAGVEIDLLVRGICCLRPGVPGVSDRIRVTSVVDRFLEHSRVFAFGVGERTEVYLSSADWMPRNFQRRIEVMWPVESAALRKRLLDEVLGLALLDNVKASRLAVDGRYVRNVTQGLAIRSQQSLLNAARLASEPAVREAVPVLRQVAAPPVPDTSPAPARREGPAVPEVPAPDPRERADA